MVKLRLLKIHSTKFLAVLFFFFLIGAYANIFALFTPGQTLDPNCNPEDVGCTVEILPTQLGNIGKYLTTDGTNASWSSTPVGITATSSEVLTNKDLTSSSNTFPSLSTFINDVGYVTGTPWASLGYITNGNTGWNNIYGFITGYIETDPTIFAWAKSNTKPTYTAVEVGAPSGSGTSSGTNTGDNSANTTYANDYRLANFVAGTNYLAPNGSAASLTSFPIFNQSTTGNAATATNLTGLTSTISNLNTVTGPLGTAAFTATGAYATSAQINSTNLINNYLSKWNGSNFVNSSIIDNGSKIIIPSIQLTSGATDGYFLKSDAQGNGTWTNVAASQVYKGSWNATTNTPNLIDGTGTAGWYYRCTIAGTWNSISFNVGDDVSYNGTTWERIPSQGYTLQTASNSVLGGIKIGSGLNIDGAGVASVSTNYESPISSGLTSQYWRGDKSWQTLDKSTVGLSNVTNESKATMFASPTFTGTVSGITATMVGAPSGSGTSSGANTGDNSANTTYANDYRLANFIAGTNYLAPNGSAAALTSFPIFNQSTTGNAATATNLTGLTSTITNLNTVTGPLGTAAFTATGAYATSAQGTLATNALPTSSFSDAAVTGKLITGFVSGAGTVVSGDTILQAINKLNGNNAGKQASSSSLTSLSGLTWTSGSPFVKMTAVGTFALDTNTYVTGTPWTGMGYLTSFIETDPTVSAWAKAGTKPTYTASEVGLGNVPNISFSGSNTGDETQSTIKTKLGSASSGVDGYLLGTDWNIFNNKVSMIYPGAGIPNSNGSAWGTSYSTSGSGTVLALTTTPTFTTNITSPLILGGSATTSPLTFQTTSGVGTTGADMHFKVGNAGGTEAMTILNNGKVNTKYGIDATNYNNDAAAYFHNPNVDINLAINGGGSTFNSSDFDGMFGSMFSLSSTSNSIQNNQTILSVSNSGSNANSVITYGSYITNTHTGTSSTNIAGYFGASGGTNNYGLIVSSGSVGIGTTLPTAKLHLSSGSATAGTSPLKFTSGPVLGTTEAGAVEYDGTHLYFTATNAGTRYQLDQQSSGGNAANITGGLGGQLLYQSAVDTTAKLANGGAGQILVSGGGTVAPSWTDAPIKIVNSSNLFSNLPGTGSGVTTVTNSIFLGENAGNNATTAINSNFFGFNAGTSDPVFGGVSNSNFFGYEAGREAFASYNSNFFGFQAGNGAVTSPESNFFGSYSGVSADAMKSNFLGYYSGYQAINASYSNFIGSQAGYQASNAEYSNLFGYQAGKFYTGNNIGSNNIIIGTNISLPNATTNSMNLGGVIFAKNTYATATGNPSITATATGSVGIGIISPTARLQLPAGTATSGTSPLKLTSGVNLGTTEAGAVEWDGINLFVTQTLGPTRKTIAYTTDIPVSPIAINNTSNLFSTGLTGAGSGVTTAIYSNFFGVDAGNNATGASYSNFLGYQAGWGLSGNENLSSNSNFFGKYAGSGLSMSASNSNFFGQSAGGGAMGASNSNFLGQSSGYSANNASYSNLFGYQTGKFYNGNNIGSNNIIIGTNISLPDTTANSMNLGGVIFAKNTYATTTGNPAITAVSNGMVGIGVVSPAYTLQVGNSSISGVVARFQNSAGYCDINPMTTSLVCTSDINLKKNIVTLDDIEFALQTVPNSNTTKTTLEKIMNLTPVKYNWKTEQEIDIKHSGFIAQEMEQIFPDLVFTDPVSGLKSVAFTNLIPYTIKAIQEMNIKVNDLSSLDISKATSLGSLMKNFLSDINNSVVDLYASVIHSDKVETKILCVGTTCVTEEQFLEIVNKNVSIINNTENAPPNPSEDVIPLPELDPVPPTDPTINQDTDGSKEEDTTSKDSTPIVPSQNIITETKTEEPVASDIVPNIIQKVELASPSI